jgi:hypothetical protein
MRIVVEFNQRSLGVLCAALMVHADRSWPEAEEVHEEMYALVDTLMILGVDQKWFSAFALLKGVEEMVTTWEIQVVSWCSLFCVSAVHF